MSTRPHSTDQERSLEDGDHNHGTSDFVESLKHTVLGVWDLYEHIPPKKFGIDVPRIPISTYYFKIVEDLPFVWRMVKDVIKIESCSYYLSLFALVEFLISLLPVAELWFASYFLTILQLAIHERRTDEKLLISAVTGGICCEIVKPILGYWARQLGFSLNILLAEHREREVFRISADLDVPTYAARSTLNDFLGILCIVDLWPSLSDILDLIFFTVFLVTEICVLGIAIDHQQGGIAFAIVQLSLGVFNSLGIEGLLSSEHSWIVTTNNEHFIKLSGLRQLVQDSRNRQEIVAGNLSEFLKTSYNGACAHVSGKDARIGSYPRHSCVRDILSALFPTLVYRAAEATYFLISTIHPETIPACLAIIVLTRLVNAGLTRKLRVVRRAWFTHGASFHTIRQFYKLHEVQNKIADGTVSFPGDGPSLGFGITVEFRNVSFRFPDKDDFALRNVSFKVEKGQLCVIVGGNGSGKSTVLKLVLRLYDPTEGTILVNGQDIKTLKLADLRESMAVLFQDYSHFPLSIRDNIALGDPQNADDETRIREAARMGGAEEFIDKMPRGFDTYLRRPVLVLDNCRIPREAKTRSGVKIDRELFYKSIEGIASGDSIKLAGGQMQRLAVSRMLMRSMFTREAKVGLLLLDEPSAALDPIAEHDLFMRLRELRGTKTMIFSSHRFGHLTKPADVILYMDNSTIVECGSHDELMARGGKYAESWNLQAKGFL